MTTRLTGVAVAGTGVHLSPDTVTNRRLAETLDTSDEWIVSRTGIRERRWLAPDLATSDMCLPAARSALASAGLTADDVDVVIVYLRRDAGTAAVEARWNRVIDELGTDSPVGSALRTPLMVGLARTVFNPRAWEHSGDLPDPDQLCDTTRFRTRAEVEHHLFDALIPAAYRVSPRSRRGDPDPEQVQRWLVFLGHHLEHNRHGSTDLAWWELGVLRQAGAVYQFRHAQFQ